MSYEWDFSILLQYRELLLNAALTTFQLVALSVTLGVLIGLALAPLRMAEARLLRYPATALIEFIRSTPPLVLVVWSYYCLPILGGLALSAFWTCVLAIALYSGVFFAEIFRAGVQAVDRGLVEAGLAVGMRPATVLRRVIGPVAFLRVLPPFTSQCVMAIKNSVLGSYIAVGEILYEGQRLSTQTFRPLEVLTLVAAFFVALILPMTLAAGALERRIFLRYFRR
ncbi:polar amino acid transport system permease protein [Methylopila capsulata]|uniref:Amino acid ABC transporter permease n=1 Tax=Methylopila capsulata TaxID=61654 RepID=A0A9W6IWJ4_9HYPH|nr:amino acid ABC transporter permease [Methylopila capsulata]MBM7852406.1 polar amino acid transport system permease protein [Methylopila capsulata]GLK56615.1 amino acid ABC transporter permease [Methylopila capsulata]